MAELHVLREVQSLGAADVPIILKDHHGERTTGEDVPDDVLGQQVETQLDIGDGLNDADWHGKDEGDEETNHKAPPW